MKFKVPSPGGYPAARSNVVRPTLNNWSRLYILIHQAHPPGKCMRIIILGCTTCCKRFFWSIIKMVHQMIFQVLGAFYCAIDVCSLCVRTPRSHMQTLYSAVRCFPEHYFIIVLKFYETHGKTTNQSSNISLRTTYQSWNL